MKLFELINFSKKSNKESKGKESKIEKYLEYRVNEERLRVKMLEKEKEFYKHEKNPPILKSQTISLNHGGSNTKIKQIYIIPNGMISDKVLSFVEHLEKQHKEYARIEVLFFNTDEHVDNFIKSHEYSYLAKGIIASYNKNKNKNINEFKWLQYNGDFAFLYGTKINFNK